MIIRMLIINLMIINMAWWPHSGWPCPALMASQPHPGWPHYHLSLMILPHLRSLLILHLFRVKQQKSADCNDLFFIIFRLIITIFIIIWVWWFCFITELQWFLSNSLKDLHLDEIKTISWLLLWYSEKIENHWWYLLKQNHQKLRW